MQSETRSGLMVFIKPCLRNDGLENTMIVPFSVGCRRLSPRPAHREVVIQCAGKRFDSKLTLFRHWESRMRGSCTGRFSSSLKPTADRRMKVRASLTLSYALRASMLHLYPASPSSALRASIYNMPGLYGPAPTLVLQRRSSGTFPFYLSRAPR